MDAAGGNRVVGGGGALNGGGLVYGNWLLRKEKGEKVSRDFYEPLPERFMLLPIALTLLCFAILLGWLASRLQQQTGLPRARVLYDDASDSQFEPPPLVDHRWRIAGRPDYLLEQNGVYIPVEVKPTRRARQPYDSDRLQLAAYCRLVEARYGKRPPYGILRYANDSFEIPYTPELEQLLLHTLELMAEAERQGIAHRSHEQPARCRSCSQRTGCDEALG